MEKTIIDERTGWEYEMIGEHYYPTGRVQRRGVLTSNKPSEENGLGEEKTIGVWGQRHLRYIRQLNKPLYLELCMSGKLNAYLADVNAQAEESFSRLVKEMSTREGVTEEMKARNQMTWVQWMNSIREQATEIVNNEIVFA